jgi:hypothetical protein
MMGASRSRDRQGRSVTSAGPAAAGRARQRLRKASAQKHYPRVTETAQIPGHRHAKAAEPQRPVPRLATIIVRRPLKEWPRTAASCSDSLIWAVQSQRQAEPFLGTR